jgi:hypothetical protein
MLARPLCKLEALLSWYKYLLFRNASTTAGCALLGSRNGLLILLQRQPFSFRWSALVLSTLSTFVMVQVSSLQECLHHSGIDWLLQHPFSFLWSALLLSTISTFCHGTSIFSSGMLSPQRNDASLDPYVGLLAWLLLQSRSTLVLLQVSSLQEHLHNSYCCNLARSLVLLQVSSLQECLHNKG